MCQYVGQGGDQVQQTGQVPQAAPEDGMCQESRASITWSWHSSDQRVRGWRGPWHWATSQQLLKGFLGDLRAES